MVTTEIIEHSDGLQAIEAEWRSLVPDSFDAVFSRPAWHRAWLDAVPPKRLALITARAGGKLVGVLPLSLIRSDVRGLFFPLVTSLARGDYQIPSVASDMAEEALPAMLDAAVRCFDRRSVYWLPNIPADAPVLPILTMHLRRLGMVQAMTTAVAPRLRIAGRSYQEIEAAWSARHRKEVRQKRRHLAAVGEVALTRPRTLDEAMLALEEFFVVHDEKWLSQGRPGRFQNLRHRRHFVAMVQQLWNRGLQLISLRCGAVKVFTSVCFFSGGWLLLYKPAFRTQYHRYSPGTVFISLLLEEACRSGWQGIDFLLGAEPFKFHWSNDTQQVVGLHAAFSERSLPYQWLTRGKPYLIERFEPPMAHAKAFLQRAIVRPPRRCANSSVLFRK